jgi:hypothetical protein
MKKHGYLKCKKSLINDFGTKCFTKGEKYLIEIVGCADMAVQFGVLSNHGIITVFTYWMEQAEEVDEYFQICGSLSFLQDKTT